MGGVRGGQGAAPRTLALALFPLLPFPAPPEKILMVIMCPLGTLSC